MSFTYGILDRKNSSVLQTPELKDRCIESFIDRHASLEGFNNPPDDEEEYEKQMEEFGYFLSGWPVVVDKEEEPRNWDDMSYVRLQMSWGGPSDEFRVWKSGKIEYVFLDWYTGYSLDVTQNDTVQWLYNSYLDYGINFENNSYYSHNALFKAIRAYEKG